MRNSWRAVFCIVYRVWLAHQKCFIKKTSLKHHCDKFNLMKLTMECTMIVTIVNTIVFFTFQFIAMQICLILLFMTKWHINLFTGIVYDPTKDVLLRIEDGEGLNKINFFKWFCKIPRMCKFILKCHAVLFFFYLDIPQYQANVHEQKDIDAKNELLRRRTSGEFAYFTLHVHLKYDYFSTFHPRYK